MGRPASAGRPARHGGQESPEAILRRRYAVGEIDDEEYRRRKNELDGR